jgi:hypothetical protein
MIDFTQGRNKRADATVGVENRGSVANRKVSGPLSVNYRFFELVFFGAVAAFKYRP